MSDIHDTTGNHNWNDPAAWQGGVVPVSTDDAFIDAGSSIVTVTDSESINNVTIGSTDELASNNDSGTINVYGTSIDNAGTLSLGSASGWGALAIQSSSVTLDGGGKVVLADHSQNLISGASASDKLTNVNNTVTGAGTLFLSLDNQAGGTIDATGTNYSLVIYGGAADSNEGLIEATGTGGVQIFSDQALTNTGTIEALANSFVNILDIQTAVINTTGTIEAVGAGAFVHLGGGLTIDGGTLAAVSGGTITVGGSNTVDGAAINIDASSTLQMVNAITSTNGSTSLIIDSNGTTFSGGGKVVLSDAFYVYNNISGQSASDQLTNVDNTITGAGTVSVALDNQLLGTINANGANRLAIGINALTNFSNEGLIETTGTGGLFMPNAAVTNTGTIEALTNSTLTIYYSTITNTGGTIQAVGTNAFVDLLPATINNGTLATSGGGTIQTTDSNSTIDTATINNASKLVVNDNTHLTLGSTVNNTGTVSIASAGNGTFLIIDANGATLQGKGTVTLTDRSNNVIEGSAAADVLTNVDNTISGAGQFGNGQLTLVNQSAGIINGSGKLNSLILDTGSGSFGNAGTIEATGAGGLNIVNSTGTNSGTIESLTKSSLTIQNSTINNSKSTVTATGKSAFVALSSATINDGTLATSTSGTIKTTGGNSTIDKATINNASNFVVSDNTDLTLGSTVNNTATFSIASAGNGTFLIVDGNGVAFAAGGTVALTDRSSNIIEGSASADVLTNVDNTIMGAGQLGNG